MGALVDIPVQRSRLILDGDIAARHILVFAPDEVANLFILRLLNSTLVVLGSLAQELLLDEVDAC